ncbi:MAG: lipopolysaccharide heptosyltransferase family protein, partial [Acidobacteria bacterium]
MNARTPTPTPSHSYPPRRILILHFGQLAEVILSLPAIEALHRRFAHSHITLASTTAGCLVATMTSTVSDVLAVASIDWHEAVKPWVVYEWIRLIQALRHGGYDLTIDFHSVGKTNVLAWLSRAPWRLAARRPGRPLPFLFNLHPPREDVRKHLVDRYLDVLRPLGVVAENRQPRLTPPREARAQIERRLASRLQRGRLLVGLHPGQREFSRRWPPAQFIDLGARLIHNLNVDLLLLEGQRRSRWIREIGKQLPIRPIILGGLSIPELAAALTTCSVV